MASIHPRELFAAEPWPRWNTHLPILAPSLALESSDASSLARRNPAVCLAPRPAVQCEIAPALLDACAGGHFTRAASEWIQELQDRVALYSLAALVATECGRGAPFAHSQKRVAAATLSTPKNKRRSLLLPEGVPHGDAIVDRCMVAGGTKREVIDDLPLMPQRWMDEYDRRAASLDEATLPTAIRTSESEMAWLVTIAERVTRAMLRWLRDLITLEKLQSKNDPLCEALIRFFDLQAAAPVGNDTAAGGRAFEPFVPDANVDRALDRSFEPGLARMTKRDQASWYHSPEKVDYWASQYAQGRVPEGDTHFWQRHHIRPVQHYGTYRHRLVTGGEIGSAHAGGFLPHGRLACSPLMGATSEYASFDIVDASGRVWPLFVHIDYRPQIHGEPRVPTLHGGNIYLRAGGDASDSFGGWENWPVTTPIAKLNPRGRVNPFWLWCIEHERVRENYTPWGLFSEERATTDPTASFSSSSSSTSRLVAPSILDKRQPLEYAATICSAVEFRQFLQSGSDVSGECRCQDPIHCRSDLAATLEFEQLIAVALDLIIDDDHPPALFSANHPLAARVQFTYAVLMRMFNPPTEDLAADEGASAAVSLTPTSPLTWLPNVLLEMIAEYAPLDQLPFVTV